MVAILVLLALLAAPVSAHDWYTGLSVNGVECCGGRDCAPRDSCIIDGAEGLIAPGGRCVPYNPAAVVPTPSPDGLEHGCWRPAIGQVTEGWRCVIRAAGT